MCCARRLRARRWMEPGRWRHRSASPAIPPASIRRGARLRGTTDPRPLPEWAMLSRSCCVPRADWLRLCHELIPSPPESAQLKIVGGEWLLALHAAREIRPSDLAIDEAALTRLEHLDVIWRGKPTGSKESQKVVEPQRRVFGAFVNWRQRPCVDFHVVRRNRIEGSNRDRHDVVDDQVGKDHQVAAGLADEPGALFAEALVEAAPQLLEVGLTMLAEWRRPLRDRPSPRDLKFYDRVTIAEIDRSLMLAEVPHVHAEVLEEAEISLMDRHRVVPVDAVLGHQLPVGPRTVRLLARHYFHPDFRLVDDQVEVFSRAGQIVVETVSRGIETGEDEAAIAVNLRWRGQS